MPHCIIADEWHDSSTGLGQRPAFVGCQLVSAQPPRSDSHASDAVYLVQSGLQVSQPCLTSV